MNTTTPDPGAGHRLLGPDEPWLITDSCMWNADSTWYFLDDKYVGETCTTWHSKKSDLYRRHGTLHVRRKVTDPIALLTQERDAARAKLEAAEAALKEATEIKIGDWVISLEDNSFGLTKGKLYQVAKMTPYSSGSVHFSLPNDGAQGKSGGWSSDRFRRAKATPTEIEAHLKAHPPVPPLPKLHGHDGVYSKDDDVVTYGCAVIYLAHLRHLFNLSVFGKIGTTRTIAAIVSNKGETVTLDEIRSILTHVDYINSH